MTVVMIRQGRVRIQPHEPERDDAADQHQSAAMPQRQAGEGGQAQHCRAA